MFRNLILFILLLSLSQTSSLYACPGYGPTTLPQAVILNEMLLKNITTDEFLNSRIGYKNWILDKQSLVKVINPFVYNGFLKPERYGTITLKLKLSKNSQEMVRTSLTVFSERPLFVDQSLISIIGFDKYIYRDELVHFSFNPKKPVSELSFHIPDIYSPARFLIMSNYLNTKTDKSINMINHTPSINVYCDESRRLVETLQVANNNCDKLRTESWSQGVNVNDIVSSCKKRIKIIE